MRVLEPAQHVAGDAQRPPPREPALALEEIAERLALEQLHHQEERAVVGGAGVEHRDAVGVIEPDADERLALEPRLGFLAAAQERVQHLDGDVRAPLATPRRGTPRPSRRCRARRRSVAPATTRPTRSTSHRCRAHWPSPRAESGWTGPGAPRSDCEALAHATAEIAGGAGREARRAPTTPTPRARPGAPRGSCAPREDRGRRRRPAAAAVAEHLHGARRVAVARGTGRPRRSGRDHARADRGDADAVRLELGAQRLRQPEHGELARDVRGRARRREDAEDARRR